MLLIALCVAGLGATLPADWLLYSFVNGSGKPEGFAICSVLLVPALAIFVAAGSVRRTIKQNSSTRPGGLYLLGFAFYAFSVALWLIAAIPLGLLWLVLLAVGGSSPG